MPAEFPGMSLLGFSLNKDNSLDVLVANLVAYKYSRETLELLKP
jgi:hypothetical protein